MNRTVLASVALQQLILDADERHVPYDQYNLKVGFVMKALREPGRGGTELSVQDKAVLSSVQCTSTLQDMINQRDENMLPEKAPWAHLSLTNGEGGVDFILTCPVATLH